LRNLDGHTRRWRSTSSCSASSGKSKISVTKKAAGAAGKDRPAAHPVQGLARQRSALGAAERQSGTGNPLCVEALDGLDEIHRSWASGRFEQFC
jgi:hypothetical protein